MNSRQGKNGTQAARERARSWRLLVVLAVATLAAACLGIALVGVAKALPGTTTSSLVLKGDVKKSVDDLQAQADAVQAEIAGLDEQLAKLTESYNQTNIQIDQTNVQLIELRRQLRDAQARYSDQQELIRKRIVGAYKAGDNSLLEILFSTDTFSDFIKRLILVFRVAQSDNAMVADMRTSTDELAAVNRKVEEIKSQGLALRVQLETKRKDIEGLLNQRKDVLTNLDGRIASIIEQERQRQEAERKQLEAELRARLGLENLYNGPLPDTSSDILNQVLQTAATYLGIPYTWGGEHPSTGMDCSGFTMYVFRQHGVELPHFAADQQLMGVEVSEADARPGDLVFFGQPAYHVAIYIGDGKIIEAPKTGDVIKVSLLSEKQNLAGFRRYPLVAREGPPAFD